MSYRNANQLLASFGAKEYFVDNREFALNLIGVRAKSRRAGKYDDYIIGLRLEDNDWIVYQWPATVDASVSYLKRPINKAGTAGLVAGQYLDTWKIDSHNGWVRTLCQRSGPVRVYRDNDRDTTYDYSESKIQKGYFGINFHPDRNEPSGKSGRNWRSSAGCQVFRYREDHRVFMELVDQHNNLYGNLFSYTLFEEKDIYPMPTGDKKSVNPPKEDPPAIVEEDPEEETFDIGGMDESQKKWATWIINKEARRDRNGNIMVYKLPSGDGGGSFEVAGINDRYHKKMANKLKSLINEGRADFAEVMAQDYIRSYTSQVASWHDDERVVYFLRDCAFNRGPTGAAKIYQIALRSAGSSLKLDGKVGPSTKKAGNRLAAEDLVFRLVLARQTYERRTRSESSKFWVGLVNRNVDCGQMALGIGDPNRFGK